MEIAVWMLGSALGRKILLGGLMALAVLALIAKIYSAGKSAEKARQANASLEHLRKRIQTDDEVTKLAPDARRERLRQWVSPDSGV